MESECVQIQIVKCQSSERMVAIELLAVAAIKVCALNASQIKWSPITTTMNVINIWMMFMEGIGDYDDFLNCHFRFINIFINILLLFQNRIYIFNSINHVS